MKKILAFLLVTVMALSLLTGCGNPVYDEFENFLNVEMAEPNANYELITEEAATWAEMATAEEMLASIRDVLLPLVDDSLAKVNAIELTTEEVKEVKAKYIAVMEAYKAGFEALSAGLMANDEAKMIEGNDKVAEAIELLNDYNASLEALAEEVGATVEY